MESHQSSAQQKQLLSQRSDKIVPFEIFEKNLQPSRDTRCGIWIFKWAALNKLANKNVYTTLYGIVGCLYSACFAYFNGTATTIEKQIKISSRMTGTISTANNVTQTFINVLLSYYVSKKSNPRWVAIGILTMVFYCLFNLMPYAIYGPGDDALKLTHEYGDGIVENYTIVPADNLCAHNRTVTKDCDARVKDEYNLAKIFMFIGNFVSGIGGSLISIIGMTYIDDNVNKSDAPAIISFTVFIRLLGPAIGLNLASYCLAYYVVPYLHPLIEQTDPRWIGAWWMGWIVLAVALLLPTFFMSMFPKVLPRTRAKKEYKQYKIINDGGMLTSDSSPNPSLIDLKNTIVRLVTNKIYMFNNIAGVFYAFGYMHLMFAPKYMEVQFRLSSSRASMTMGTVHLTCQAIGVILCGVLISRIKPKARTLAMWNIGSSILSTIGILLYSVIACDENDAAIQNTISQNIRLASSCDMTSCNCDTIRYSPVCGSDNITYISPCHAGCSSQNVFGNSTHQYSNCSCIDDSVGKYANSGACPIDCSSAFTLYLIVIAFNKFLGGTEGASNLLLGIRSVDERDKAVSIGLKLMMFSVLAQVPAPIIYGWLVDLTCIVWGGTCQGSGNCWLYDSVRMRQYLNYTSAGCIILGTIFDIGVWYLAKNVNLFDENPNAR